MRVSLKKAAALATALAAVSISIPTGISISMYGDISDYAIAKTLKAGKEEQTLLIYKAGAYSEAVYKIRHLIGEANAGKINSLLTERAAIDKQLQILNSITLVDKEPDFLAISKQLDAMLNAPQEVSYRSNPNTLVITIPTADVIAPLIKQFKKRRIGVEDQLAHLNFTTEIELPDDVVEILREVDLI